MPKHAQLLAARYRTLFDPLPISSNQVLFFDKEAITLPYVEDFPNLHYHDRYEIGICESGEGLFLSDGVFSSISTGDYVFIAPNHYHYSRSLNENNPCICRFAYLRAETAEHLLALATTVNQEQPCIVKKADVFIPPVIHASEHPKAAMLLSEILQSCKPDIPYAAPLALLRLSVFLLEAQSMFDPVSPVSSATPISDKAVAKTSEYLSLHYNRSDTAQALAAQCHLSESQLRRRFLVVYGMPPIAYRNYLRNKIAAELLIGTRLPISEISERIGYSTASDFYRAFKKTFGISPSAYRAKNDFPRQKPELFRNRKRIMTSEKPQPSG